jgi:diguanylate cyclase (GGDEF)-like protein/PAS domain S-box-containing protein
VTESRTTVATINHEPVLANRLLVVDDQEVNRDLLMRRLERRGFRVWTAKDGQEALDLLDKESFDLVLLDVMLPGTDGIEVLRNIRSRATLAELPVVMVSAKDDSQGIVQALSLGANDYITKPVDFPVVLARIQTHLSHKKAKAALRESEERYALAVAGANDGLWDWDLRNNKVYYSPRWRAMIGEQEETLENDPQEWFSRVHPDDLDRLKKDLDEHFNQLTVAFENEHRMLHRDGSYRWVLSRGMAVRDSSGAPYRVAGSQTDITARKVYDPLTGLPNRILFMDRLEHALQRFKRSKSDLFAVLLVDLDRFKIVNEGLGHNLGDKLLIHMSRRLKTCVRTGDTIARFGGDEFIILLDEIKDISDAIRVAERIQQSLKTPFQIAGQEVFTTTSVGIAISTTGYDRGEDVVRDADTAMNRAKALGKARHEMFDRAMHTQSAKRLQLETDLRKALDRGEFEVRYQAIVALENTEIAGFEALIRWHHPQRGLVNPDEFISVAEETGLIVPMDQWVLRRACLQTKEWQGRYGPLTVSVNLSARQFANPDLVDQIIKVLDETKLDPESLKLEITESALMENTDTAAEIIARLKAQRIKLGLDDFGTGYSSLSYLHRFPVDTLKIDRSFISRMEKDGEHSAIVKTIVALAQNMAFTTVAEGIETDSQLASLKELECRYGQGYYFSKPISAEDAELLLQQYRGAPQVY